MLRVAQLGIVMVAFCAGGCALSHERADHVAGGDVSPDLGPPIDGAACTEGEYLCGPEAGVDYGSGIQCVGGHWEPTHGYPCYFSPPPRPDAGPEACTDEGRFICGSPSRECCGGHWREFWDGPCWPAIDAGA